MTLWHTTGGRRLINVRHACNAAAGLTSRRTTELVHWPPTIIIRPEIRFSMRRTLLGLAVRRQSDDGETGNTNTTSDGGTVALSIIQYHLLSKSEKPDILAADVVRARRMSV